MESRRIRFCLTSAGVAAVLLAVTYLVFVRTEWGQHFDDIAFDGRGVEDPEVTRETDELLHRITRSSLFLLTGTLVAVALARHRLRLAVVVGASVTASVVTTEVLKLHVLTRPEIEGIAGIPQNSFPSGHATIGMALSLGWVMVSPHAWRWLSAAGALGVAMFFGIGVLATGWHRPSDTLGAYLVCVIMFGLGTAALIRWRGVGRGAMGGVEARLTPSVALLAGALAVVASVFVLVDTFTSGSLRTVEFALDYLAVCVVLLAIAAVIVIGYHQSLRGVSLDTPEQPVESPAVEAGEPA